MPSLSNGDTKKLRKGDKGDPMERPLKIYKASAGSGKTFTLTVEYLKLLFIHFDDPYGFRSILAVTFTNKATAEMKSRILTELYRLSIGDKEGVYPAIQEATGLSDTVLSHKAKDILINILEDYSAFRIQTIDSFFQEIVRSFALELNRNNAFGIEMDYGNVVSLSVENLIERLDDNSEGIRALRTWVQEVYKEGIDEEVSLNPFNEISKLAIKLLFSEENRAFFNVLSHLSREKVTEAKNRLKIIIKDAEELFLKTYEEIATRLSDFGLDLSESTRGCLKVFSLSTLDRDFCLMRMSHDCDFGNTIYNIAYGEMAFYPKKVSAEAKALYDENDSEIRELLRKIIETRTYCVREKVTAELILSHLNVIPGIIELRNDIEEYRKSNNVLIISDINELLNSIINDSEVPFIYEKVGSRIKHYMIDEFQDTSPLQWLNFRPLLRESLDNAQPNLIVGDVKQSIYRFRGTDSSLLGSQIGREFPDRITAHTLVFNWRSQSNIVSFNNSFFDNIYDFPALYNTTAECIEREMTEHAASYTDVRQQLPEKTKERGLVTLTETPYFKKSEDYFDTIAPLLEDKLIQLQSKQGFSPSDIAFLVRTKAEGAKIADFLTQLSNKYDDRDDLSFTFLSDEALLINNSIVVRLLACLLKCFASPGSQSPELELTLHLDRYNSLYGPEIIHLGASLPTSEALLALISHGLSIYETVTMAIDLLAYIPSEEELYVNSFMDILFGFASHRSISFGTFVEMWEDKCSTLMVSMGEAQLNSITITTIHKSKGLEYPVVIIPFGSWDVTKKSGTAPKIISSETLPEHFRILPFYIVPISFAKLESSYFADFALRQYEMDYTDTLNLLYVAFTRASEELHIYFPKSKDKVTSGKIISERLASLSSDPLPLTVVCDEENDSHIYSLGAEVRIDTKAHGAAGAGHFTLKGLSATPRYDALMLSTKGYETLFETEAERRKGIVMHEVLSHTTDKIDFERRVRKEVAAGRIASHEGEAYISSFADALRSPVIAGWFDIEKQTSICEQEIMSPQGTYRPDKVILHDGTATVIDYKFGIHNDSKYGRQVRTYLGLLKRMGYSNPQGYIWYNVSDDIVLVTLD